VSWNTGADTNMLVMPGLDPAIHQNHEGIFRRRMDGRVKPGHDEEGSRFARPGMTEWVRRYLE
jgi:hypothetical protein